METPVSKDKKFAALLVTILCIVYIVSSTIVLLAVCNLASVLLK